MENILNGINICDCLYSIEDGELATRARQTLEAVKQRVEVELVAAPLLVSAALADSSHLSIKGLILILLFSNISKNFLNLIDYDMFIQLSI